MRVKVVISNRMRLTPELAFTLNWLFSEVLDLNWKYKQSHDEKYKLCIEGKNGFIEFPNVFLNLYNKHKIDARILPKNNLSDLVLRDFSKPNSNDSLPVLYGSEKLNF